MRCGTCGQHGMPPLHSTHPHRAHIGTAQCFAPADREQAVLGTVMLAAGRALHCFPHITQRPTCMSLSQYSTNWAVCAEQPAMRWACGSAKSIKVVWRSHGTAFALKLHTKAAAHQPSTTRSRTGGGQQQRREQEQTFKLWPLMASETTPAPPLAGYGVIVPPSRHA